MLNRRGMKKTDLQLSSKTIAKLSKGSNLNTDVIDKICKQLNCQPADIMEYVEEKSWIELWTDEAFEMIWNRYDIYHDAISKEDFKEIVLKCIDKRAVGELRIFEDKLIRLIKEKADLTKLNL